MDAVLNWGLELIRSVQTIASPAVTVLFKAITFIGNEEFYLLVMPFVFWNIDRRKGIRLAAMILFSNFINQSLKALFAQPRPFELDSSLGLAHADGYGLPSGHSQGSATFWGTLAPWYRYGRGVAVLIVFLVGLSRIYLGVHFPTDVFAGWGLGLLLLVLYYRFGDAVEAAVVKARRLPLLLLIAGIAAVMLLLNSADSVTPALILGASAGLVLMERSISFSPEGTVLRKIIRYLIGAAGLAALYLGLKFVFPDEGVSGYAVLRFTRYLMLGLWITAGAPWLFLRLKLSATEAAAE